MGKDDFDLDELRDGLGDFRPPDQKTGRTPREERIIAGFEDIERFFEEHGRLPTHGEGKDIFERIYAVRLETLRSSDECRTVLAGLDKHELLDGKTGAVSDELDDEELLAELEELSPESDLTRLRYVRPRAEIKTAEEIAQRTPCRDFVGFRTLFDKVQDELKSGVRKTRPFRENAQIQKGDFFILGGQKVFVAEMGEEFIADYGRPDRRLRVIYDNGTESNILMRSLQRALNKDAAGRRISNPAVFPLFSDVSEDTDTDSGTIYVLRSQSEHPLVRDNRSVIHKIGVTGGDIKRRLADAKNDPTFLMAEAEVIATYELANINRTRLENLLHRFFEPARLNIGIRDRFGQPVTPREWFLVPLTIINEAIDRIRNGTIVNCYYDPTQGKIVDKG